METATKVARLPARRRQPAPIPTNSRFATLYKPRLSPAQPRFFCCAFGGDSKNAKWPKMIVELTSERCYSRPRKTNRLFSTNTQLIACGLAPPQSHHSFHDFCIHLAQQCTSNSQ